MAGRKHTTRIGRGTVEAEEGVAVRVKADTEGVSLRELRDGLVAMGRQTDIPLLLGPHLYGDLVRLAGGPEKAMREVAGLARAIGRPVCVNVPRGGGASSSVWLGPPSWPQARIEEYAGRYQKELEEEFGPAAGEPYRIGGQGQGESPPRRWWDRLLGR
jgi:hypothetical protein